MAEDSFTDKYQRADLLRETIAGFTPAYDPGAPAPGEPDLRLPAFSTLLSQVAAANQLVEDLSATYTTVAAQREDILKSALEAGTSVLAYLRSKKATLGPLLASAEKIVKRMRGPRSRAATPPAEPPAVPAPPARNRGQQSYREQEGHLATLVNLVTGKAGYTPLPAATHHAGVAWLNGVLSSFRSVNTHICTVDADLIHAENVRSDLYENKATGLHGRFLAVKASVQAQYGTASPQFASANGIVW